eukprot:snap_masked-scaffold_19-processed-gene-5.6-mRNA-1 protein AED:1.00 eAED:1.00 QI:0/-1/0/0/-1/1/1/0/227
MSFKYDLYLKPRRNAAVYVTGLSEDTKYSDLLIPSEGAESGDPFSEEEDWVFLNVKDFYDHWSEFLYLYILGNTRFQNACEKGLLKNQGYPSKVLYKWKEEKEKEGKVLSAYIYIENVFSWVERVIYDNVVFPTLDDEPFPEDFRYRVGKIMTRMFRVFAIVYSNMKVLELKGGEIMSITLDLLFKRFIWFCWVWNFLPEKEEKAIIEKVASLKEEFNEAKEKHYTY